MLRQRSENILMITQPAPLSCTILAKLAAARQACGQAHAMQTRLSGHDEGSGNAPVTLNIVDAQDHLMTAVLCQDLAAELILLRREMAEPTCG